MKIKHQKNYSHVDFLPNVLSKRLSLSNKFRFLLEKEKYNKQTGCQRMNQVYSTMKEKVNTPVKIVCLNGINPDHNGIRNNLERSRFYIPEKINIIQKQSHNLNKIPIFNVSPNENFDSLSEMPTITYLNSRLKSIETEKFLTLQKQETTARSASNFLETKRNLNCYSDEKMMQTIQSSHSKSKSRCFPQTNYLKTFEILTY